MGTSPAHGASRTSLVVGRRAAPVPRREQDARRTDHRALLFATSGEDRTGRRGPPRRRTRGSRSESGADGLSHRDNHPVPQLGRLDQRGRSQISKAIVPTVADRASATATKHSSGSSPISAAAHDRFRPEARVLGRVEAAAPGSALERGRRPSGGNGELPLANRGAEASDGRPCRMPSLGASCWLHNAALLRLVTRFSGQPRAIAAAIQKGAGLSCRADTRINEPTERPPVDACDQTITTTTTVGRGLPPLPS